MIERRRGEEGGFVLGERGFTLVEIAIVLVIIGLLLGGVLKAQSMIENSRVKRLASDTNATIAAINAYMDSYATLPGDDIDAQSRGFAAAPDAGDGDGLIDGSWVPAAGNFDTDETAQAWNHTRCAGLTKGNCIADTVDIEIPLNSFGGYLGIGDGRAITADLGISKKLICMEKVPGEAAAIYDTQQDDGVGTTGSIRGSAANETAQTAAPTATSYATTANTVIFICTGF
ncbi:MAG: type II secretion system protein [Magnetococcales bacterium]|nr:type II secretion system protein [Magnetococcales bacterium]